ncbi:HupE-UreJ family cobalt transporter [uncultured Synechococcales cyanobacterium]|uniref:HupE-UreJ family cobalt transporter n=1 Tax=uncultured Synechococcales cyanobacterium TaxID=1936017 RepID=A0A6J4VNR6_9CYAN|nr:HupE-UreJ family cobalt transporter [uncultured Synechococcales cyanobacterium]
MPLQKWLLSILKGAGLIWIGLLSAIEPAAAHHTLAGKMPSNFFEGFLSGLAHPVVGLDHLAFIVAVGLLSASQPRGILISVVFLLTALTGTGVHLLNSDLPGAEIVISISVLALGLMLVVGKQASFNVLAGLAGLAGLFHGYAYGETIVGAEMTPLVAYLAGFTVIQYAVAMLAVGAGSLVFRASRSPLSLMRMGGCVISVIGTTFLLRTISH